MGLFDSQQFLDQQTKKRLLDLEKQVADLQDPSNLLTVSTLNVTDSDTVIDSDGIKIGGNQVIQDGKWIADLINSNLDTDSKLILGSFSFGASGAIAINTDANNGVWISPTGILAKQAGVTTMTIPISGSPTFKGTIVAGSAILASISAANITAGTFTGFTIQTAASGARCVITSDNGYQFYYDGTFKGKIISDYTQGIIYDTAGSSHFFRSGATEYAQINTSGLLLPSNKALIFTGGGRIIGYGGYLKVEGASGGIMDLQIEGNVYPNSDNSRQCGTADKRWQDVNAEDIHVDDLWIGSGGNVYVDGDDGSTETFDVVTLVAYSSTDGNYRKTKTLTVKKGIITDISAESGRIPW